MADFQQKNDLDLRFGGSTLGDFGSFYDVELPWLYACINSIRRNKVCPDSEAVEPVADQFKVEDGKIYIRSNTNSSWIFLFEQAYGGGLHGVDETVLTDSDLATISVKANKIAVYDGNGKIDGALYEEDKATQQSMANKLAVYDIDGNLPSNITGSAASIAGKRVEVSGIQDGQIICYDEGTNTWRPTDKFSGVGTGKSLVFQDSLGVLASYNGGATTTVDAPIRGLLPDTLYSVGDIANTNQLASNIMLVCVNSGTTPATIPALTGGS